MNPDIFAEWHSRQGHQVIKTESSYWCEQGPRIYQAFPYHWVIEPSQDELKQLLISNSAIGLRYSTIPSASNGISSYHVVYEDNEYLLERLPKKARYDVRKGMNLARVEPIPFSQLATEGWQLRYETLERQGRTKAENRRFWEVLCRTADGLHGFEAWGALVQGKMTAALIAFTCDDCCSILYQQSLTKYLPFSVNSALTYEFTNQVLKRPGKPWIFYGLHSLDAPASVDEFKLNMGFIAKPVKQRVVFHPIIAPLFNPISYKVIKQLKLWNRSNTSLAKMEGMVRFYLQGKDPAIH
jgi:hypothetical protein